VSADYWNLSASDFSQDWSDKGLITASDDWSRVASIVGFRGDGLTTTTGTDPRTITGSGTPVIDVNANQTNPNTFSTGGVTEFDIANPVVALTGSGTAAAPYLALYLNATGRQNITLSFNLRDIDGSTDNAVQPIAVQYRLNGTSDWVNVPDGYVADATGGPSAASLVTAVSVTLPADANNAGTLEVRIMTTNAVGNDEWVGVDDIRVSTTAGSGNVPGALSISNASISEGNSGSQNIEFIVSRIGGADGAVDATYTVTLPGGFGGASESDFGTTEFTGTVRFESGQSAARISLPVLGDVAPEPNETFTVTISNATGGATIDRATATGTILNDDVLPLMIGQIQGEGHTSAFVGQTVVTQGIVTAVDSNGFYIQDLGDGNSRTSDAVFVFTSTAPEFLVGDSVTVRGAVSEFRAGTGGLTVTQIISPTVTLEGWDNELPQAALIGAGGLQPPTEVIDDDGLGSFDPTTDGIDFWESLEGMRVTIDAPLVVSGTTTDSFAETDVVASLGAGATGLNDRGGITISEGDFNPEKIQIQGDRAVYSGFTANYSIGDQLSSVTGVVNYAAARYEVIVTEAVTVTRDVTLTKETTELQGDETHLTMATYNVENLDPSDNKYDILASNIVYNLRAPDIIALQEIQDDNGAASGGTLSGAANAQGLINAIGLISTARYAYVEVAPTTANSTGGEANGNIRNGFLYNMDRVSYVEGSAELITGAAYNNTRKPLVADFTFGGETITAINVHLTSRIGSDPLWGATQPPADAADAARTAQTAGIKAYVSEHLADNPNLNFAIMGDWNGFAWETAQTQLTDPTKGGVFTDASTLLPEEERYSYMFEGNAQLLDHILVTGGLLAGAQYDAVHLNAQFAGSRPTDHDAQVVMFDFGGQSTVDAAKAQDAVLYGTEGFDFSALKAPVQDDQAAWDVVASGTKSLAVVSTAAYPADVYYDDAQPVYDFAQSGLHHGLLVDSMHLV
jgi:predicted extracellular nuclease